MAARIADKPGGEAVDVTIGDMTTTRVAGRFSPAATPTAYRVGFHGEVAYPGVPQGLDDVVRHVGRAEAAGMGGLTPTPGGVIRPA